MKNFFFSIYSPSLKSLSNEIDARIKQSKWQKVHLEMRRTTAVENDSKAEIAN
jgi:hypothetical protein